jgi:RNA polymerase sigma factor (sigma-70 family)
MPSEHFATTQWSLVRAAGVSASPEAKQALEKLCATYWYPLYAFARRRTGDADLAQDLTQAFLAQLLEKNTWAVADPVRGRFRSFLLSVFKNFLLHEAERARAQKRGGGRRILSIDFDDGESRYRLKPTDRTTPEQLFDRQWAIVLLDTVLAALRSEQIAAGKVRQFEVLKQYLTPSEGETAYAVAAEQLGMNEGAVKTAVHRLRKRYRELLKSTIAETLSDPADLEEELRELFRSLG